MVVDPRKMRLPNKLRRNALSLAAFFIRVPLREILFFSRLFCR